MKPANRLSVWVIVIFCFRMARGQNPGGYLTKFNIPFWQKRYPFCIPFIGKRYASHIKHLMTGHKGNSEFRFPETLSVSRGEAEGEH